MSAIETTERARLRREPNPLAEQEELPDLPLTPREGWTSLIALTVMIVTLGVAIDDSRWAGNSIGSTLSQSGFLWLTALISVLLGTWLAKSTLSTVKAHVVSAVTGAVLLLFFIGNAISRAPSLEGRLRDLNYSVATFFNEVLVLGTRSFETSIFLLLLGSLVWAAGQFAAFTVFRRRRPLPAIVLVGAMMLLNISITVRDQYLHLVFFVAAAMVLIVRLNLLEQVREWRSRGMRDVANVSASFLRNGAVFILVAIIGSTTLAANASSAPLARVWNNFDDELLEVGYAVNRWLGGVSGAARGPNILFTPSQTIRDVWQSSTEIVFSASVSDGAGRRWRGATYDSFDGRTWQQLDRDSRLVEAGMPILGGTSDEVSAGAGRVKVDVTVIPADYGGDVFVAPASPVSVDQPTEIQTNGARGGFVAGKLSFGIQPDVPYSVSSLVRATSGMQALTASQLALAGNDYPRWVSRYTEIRPESVGPSVRATAISIRNSLPANRRDPFHIADAVQDYLYRTGDFTYATDVRGVCTGEKLVDCFLRVKVGFCEYFATTMVMLLRELDIPARYVLGYLPGREQDNDQWLVDRSAAHSWVEVYFPDHGWVEFDPTPGNTENGQAPTVLPIGDPRASRAPGAEPPGGQGELECDDGICEEPGGITPPVLPPPPAPPSESVVPVAALVGLISLTIVLALWVALRRFPSNEPDLAYNGIARLATRLGYGPRPAQTAYEYAHRLGELVPVARSDLALIATAKVEATYGRRVAGESALRGIADAYRRVRVGLLRLIFRRPRLGRGPRSTRSRRF